MSKSLVESDSKQPTPMDLFLGDLELAGQIAYRSGIKSSFSLWPGPIMETAHLEETLMKGTMSINEAMESCIGCGCNSQEIAFRNAVLTEVIKPEDREFLSAKPSEYVKLMQTRHTDLIEQGDVFPVYKYSVGAVKGLIGILIATRMPNMQYRFQAEQKKGGAISVKEELVAGTWGNVNNIGPHSRHWLGSSIPNL